jgi:hypothetical protein
MSSGSSVDHLDQSIYLREHAINLYVQTEKTCTKVIHDIIHVYVTQWSCQSIGTGLMMSVSAS